MHQKLCGNKDAARSQVANQLLLLALLGVRITSNPGRPLTPSAADAEDDEEEDQPAQPDAAPKTRKEQRSDWEQLNDNQAIWLRKPSEVTADEYQKFYKAVSKASGRSLCGALPRLFEFSIICSYTLA